MNTGPLYYIHVNLTVVLLLALIVLIAGLTTAKTIPVTNYNNLYVLIFNPLSYICSGCVES